MLLTRASPWGQPESRLHQVPSRARHDRAALLAWLAAAAALAGCSDDPPATCGFGDRSLPVEIAPVHVVAGALADLGDGDPVELHRPLQGGKVIYVGVQARNVDGCNVTLTAALRDPQSRLILNLEQRLVRLVDGGAGWAVPDQPLTQMTANVAACPSAVATTDVDQSEWELELRLDDGPGRTATTSVRVRPVCAVPEELDECQCQCDADFELGQPCPVDPVDGGLDAAPGGGDAGVR